MPVFLLQQAHFKTVEGEADFGFAGDFFGVTGIATRSEEGEGTAAAAAAGGFCCVVVVAGVGVAEASAIEISGMLLVEAAEEFEKELVSFSLFAMLSFARSPSLE